MRRYALSQATLEPTKHAIRNIVKVNTSKTCELFAVMPLNIRLDQIVKLRSELNTRRAGANDAEIKQVAAVDVRKSRLGCFFKALTKKVSEMRWKARKETY